MADDGRRVATPVHRLARVTGLVLAPLLLAQGKAVRARVPRLPHAPKPWSGHINGPSPLVVLGLGDSTIAGVGVDDPMLGLTAHFSKKLYHLSGRGVRWQSVGHRGATTGDVWREHLPVLLEEEHADIVFLSMGANDAIRLRSTKSAITHTTAVLDALHERFPGAVVLMSSMPAFRLFETIPHPLRAVMSGHATTLETALRPLVERYPRTLMSPPPRFYPQGFFAEDLFHPSSEGYEQWAGFALEDAVRRGVLDHLIGR